MGAEAVVHRKHYTFEEYLKLEEQEHTRFEYYDGEVFALAGGSLNHSSISGNMNNAFDTGLSEKGCRSFQSDVKVQLYNGGSYVYPDVVLTCDAEDVIAEQFVIKPVLIVEVLSPSTESYDRNEKWNHYRRIASLKYFLFVSQQKPFIELYSRSGPNALYQYQVFDQTDEVISFPELSFSISLRHIYKNIRFPESTPDKHNDSQ